MRKHLLLLFSALVYFSVSAQVKPKCLYVFAKKGIEVYHDTSLKSKVVSKLKYGELVEVVEYTDKYFKLDNSSRPAYAQWIKIHIPVFKPMHDISFREAYVPDTYLNPYLKKLDKNFLDDFNFIDFDGGPVIIANETVYANLHTYDMYREMDKSAYCGCFDYFEHTVNQSYSTDWGGEVIDIPYKDKKLDTLKYFLKIEPVSIEKYEKKRINNPYEIDTEPVAINFITNKDSTANQLVDMFYLPINNGKDSVPVNEEPHEYGSAQRYAGQLKPYNKYLLAWESFFYNGYILVDKTTGMKTEFTSGIPHISPNGKFVVDFYTNYDYEEEKLHGLSLTVSAIDTGLTLQHKFTVQLRSFIADDDIFWISDNELILHIHPTDNFIYQQCGGTIKEDTGQYVKLKIIANKLFK